MSEVRFSVDFLDFAAPAGYVWAQVQVRAGSEDGDSMDPRATLQLPFPAGNLDAVRVQAIETAKAIVDTEALRRALLLTR